MIALKVRAVHGVALNMLRGHLRALGHSEELALGKVDIRVYQTFQKVVRISLPLNIFWVSIYAAYFCKKEYFFGHFPCMATYFCLCSKKYGPNRAQNALNLKIGSKPTSDAKTKKLRPLFNANIPPYWWIYCLFYASPLLGGS